MTQEPGSTARVLITGVRGKTGVPLAEILRREGVEVLGGSSDPTSVSLPGVTPVPFSWDDRSTWSSAAEADAIHLVRPDREDAPDLVAAFVEQAGDARIVLLSGAEAGFDDPYDWAARTEHALTERAAAWTILRPSWFMQVFLDERFYRGELFEHGRLSFSSGGAGVAWIDARDIAAVAAAALLDARHDGRTYELSGPERLTLPETADVLSDVLNRAVVHTEVSIESALQGLPEGFERDQTSWVLEHLVAGDYGRVTDDVARVVGRPPRALIRLLED